jgi:hypothetical protein
MKRIYAKGRTARRKPGTMNKTESRYADVLCARLLAGEIIAYWYERWTFKLADDTRYTPDFMVQLPDGTIEAHEVKGFMETHARVKIKVLPEMFPVRCVVVRERAKKNGGGWEETVCE